MDFNNLFKKAKSETIESGKIYSGKYIKESLIDLDDKFKNDKEFMNGIGDTKYYIIKTITFPNLEDLVDNNRVTMKLIEINLDQIIEKSESRILTEIQKDFLTYLIKQFLSHEDYSMELFVLDILKIGTKYGELMENIIPGDNTEENRETT